jgi:hypothetical protein
LGVQTAFWFPPGQERDSWLAWLERLQHEHASATAWTPSRTVGTPGRRKVATGRDAHRHPHREMKAIPPDQITTECMDRGRQFISPRPTRAPAGAAFYVVHCGCRAQLTKKAQLTKDEPFYIDGDGERIP